jgi:hypothetical protein
MIPYDRLAPTIVEARAILLERIAAACHRAGRRPEDVAMVAVTKFRPIEDVIAAYKAGFRIFGENRVQEAVSKYEGTALPGAELHLLGSLQSNKAAKAVETFTCVQSIDSVKLLRLLGDRATRSGKNVRVMLELHTGESTKCGFPDLDALLAGWEEGARQGGITLCGLMTMAPFTEDRDSIRASFRALKAAERAITARFGPGSSLALSMGMTNDFEIAIEEGSTMIRIGTAIFGGRQ